GQAARGRPGRSIVAEIGRGQLFGDETVSVTRRAIDDEVKVPLYEVGPLSVRPWASRRRRRPPRTARASDRKFASCAAFHKFSSMRMISDLDSHPINYRQEISGLLSERVASPNIGRFSDPIAFSCWLC